jgi:competence protein ComEC
LSATGSADDFIVLEHGRVFWINDLRNQMHARADSFLADTLVLGYKNALDRDTSKIWTAAGIGHVWSISGFHMTLVGGWLVLLFYFIFRMVPRMTRRIPAKYPATIAAWVGLLFYLFLSGADVATVRAFLMTTLLFIAFLFGRTAFSLRNVCIAFILIFLINPHYIMQPGFQLSFAAIFGLVWYFDDRKYRKLNFWGRVWRIVKIVVMTSLVATIFTAPYVALHFYSIPIYSLIGNLILLPIFSIAIMPLVLIGTITSMFGWMAPLDIATNIYNHTFIIAQYIANLPMATIQTPHIPPIAMGAIIFGFLCMIFMSHKIKYLIAAAFLSTGILITIYAPRPLFYTTHDHELAGFVENGKLEFNKSRASNHYFAFESWRYLNFENPDAPRVRRKCPNGVCIYKTPNWNLAFISRYVPLAENIAALCDDKSIDFIVSYFKTDAPGCNSKILRGGFVIYENGRIEYTSKRWH